MSLGKTHTSHETCLCAWGAKYRQAFLMLDLLIWWQLNGMWGHLLFAIN